MTLSPTTCPLTTGHLLRRLSVFLDTVKEMLEEGEVKGRKELEVVEMCVCTQKIEYAPANQKDRHSKLFRQAAMPFYCYCLYIHIHTTSSGACAQGWIQTWRTRIVLWRGCTSNRKDLLIFKQWTVRENDWNRAVLPLDIDVMLEAQVSNRYNDREGATDASFFLWHRWAQSHRWAYRGK